MTAPAPGGGPVLVVEDDIEIREMLREVLEDEGYSVTCAEHGQEALDALRGGLQPALILLDLMMPVMNGWELLEALKNTEDFAKIPVTVVSAVADRSRLGPTRVISKPINLDVLIGAVNDVCRP